MTSLLEHSVTKGRATEVEDELRDAVTRLGELHHQLAESAARLRNAASQLSPPPTRMMLSLEDAAAVNSQSSHGHLLERSLVILSGLDTSMVSSLRDHLDELIESAQELKRTYIQVAERAAVCSEAADHLERSRRGRGGNDVQQIGGQE